MCKVFATARFKGFNPSSTVAILYVSSLRYIYALRHCEGSAATKQSQFNLLLLIHFFTQARHIIAGDVLIVRHHFINRTFRCQLNNPRRHRFRKRMIS